MGYFVVDRIASVKKIDLSKRKYDSLIGDWQRDDERVLLVKPQTYMNCSGEAVRRLFRYLPVTAKDLVVIHDDLDLSFGRIRIRFKGGAGGHRGVGSILETLGEEGFPRVRVGIGRPPPSIDPSDFVLAPIPPNEAAQLGEIVCRAADAVECLLGEGLQRAMQKFNPVG